MKTYLWLIVVAVFIAMPLVISVADAQQAEYLVELSDDYLYLPMLLRSYALPQPTATSTPTPTPTPTPTGSAPQTCYDSLENGGFEHDFRLVDQVEPGPCQLCD